MDSSNGVEVDTDVDLTDSAVDWRARALEAEAESFRWRQRFDWFVETARILGATDGS